MIKEDFTKYTLLCSHIYTRIYMCRFQEVLENYEIYDIFPQSLTTVTIAKTLCNENTVTQPICLAVIFLLAGSDPSQTDTVSYNCII